MNIDTPQKTLETAYDLIIIGGGINGCGIARDAAGRGLKVLLAEQNDLAQGTSSASTKLIHGGLRYLEHYEFRLVRESLSEREVLLTNAPHIIWPLRFVLPHHKALRPAWLLRLGLFIYDHLGGRKILPPTRSLDLKQDQAGQPLVSNFQKGFEYSDCWVDDARLVVLNALDAHIQGAEVLTRRRCTAAKRNDAYWQVSLENQDTGEISQYSAKALVNATGPWVDHLLDQTQLKKADQANVRLVRGSHVVVPKLYEHDRAYIFQNSDGRIMFAIPYEQSFTLLGTTDADHSGSADQAKISEEEVNYICESASRYFKTTVQSNDVVWTYSGIRPLYDDGASTAQEATRDYVLTLESDANNTAPLLNIFGGKITTYRRLAEDALHKLSPCFPDCKGPWTDQAPLPGGDFSLHDLTKLQQQLQHDYAFIATDWAQSLIRRYGKRSWEMLGGAQSLNDLGKHFGAWLTEAEVRFLVKTEWAKQADDILWRRSKQGLHMSEQQRQNFIHWFQQQGF